MSNGFGLGDVALGHFGCGVAEPRLDLELARASDREPRRERVPQVVEGQGAPLCVVGVQLLSLHAGELQVLAHARRPCGRLLVRGRLEQGLARVSIGDEDLEQRPQRRLDGDAPRLSPLRALRPARRAVVCMVHADVPALEHDGADAQHGELAAAHPEVEGQGVEDARRRRHSIACEQALRLLWEEIRALPLVAVVGTTNAIGRVTLEHAQLEPLRVREIVEELGARAPDVAGGLRADLPVAYLAVELGDDALDVRSLDASDVEIHELPPIGERGREDVEPQMSACVLRIASRREPALREDVHRGARCRRPLRFGDALEALRLRKARQPVGFGARSRFAHAHRQARALRA